jgi:hypothetical protein
MTSRAIFSSIITTITFIIISGASTAKAAYYVTARRNIDERSYTVTAKVTKRDLVIEQVK